MYKKYMQILFQFFTCIEHFPFRVMFSLLYDQWTLYIVDPGQGELGHAEDGVRPAGPREAGVGDPQ